MKKTLSRGELDRLVQTTLSSVAGGTVGSLPPDRMDRDPAGRNWYIPGPRPTNQAVIEALDKLRDEYDLE